MFFVVFSIMKFSKLSILDLKSIIDCFSFLFDSVCLLEVDDEPIDGVHVFFLLIWDYWSELGVFRLRLYVML